MCDVCKVQDNPEHTNFDCTKYHDVGQQERLQLQGLSIQDILHDCNYFQQLNTLADNISKKAIRMYHPTLPVQVQTSDKLQHQILRRSARLGLQNSTPPASPSTDGHRYNR